MNPYYLKIAIMCFVVSSIAAAEEIVLPERLEFRELNGLESQSSSSKLGEFSFNVEQRRDKSWILLLRDGKKISNIAESGKPNFHIWMIDDGIFVVLRPVGFCTPAGVYRIESSERQRNSVDYHFEGYDSRNNRLIFKVVENSRSDGRSHDLRLMAIE